MDHAKLLNKVDHTLLAQGATWEELMKVALLKTRETIVSHSKKKRRTTCFS